MKVQDLCLSSVGACLPETSLARAGALMSRHGVGSLPVVDRGDRVIGIVTDRAIAVELARRNAPPSEILVESVMTARPAVCSPHDDILDCLDLMRRYRVRRLPVVDEHDRLEGVLSIDDIVCHAADRGQEEEIPEGVLLDTLCEISRAYQAESGHRGLAREHSGNGARAKEHRERDRDRERIAPLDGEDVPSRGRRLRGEADADRRPRTSRSR